MMAITGMDSIVSYIIAQHSNKLQNGVFSFTKDDTSPTKSKNKSIANIENYHA
jgi:hypothetical protein